MSGNHSAQAIHDRLGHPVIDADGHFLEFEPLIRDYLTEVAGARVADAFMSGPARIAGVLRASPEKRRDTRRSQQAWWASPTKNTLDRATAILPRLLYSRLDELGIDFTVLYPTSGLFAPYIPDEEMRRAACRAFNMFARDRFAEFKDRITPAASIPMHTPKEAIDELEHAVGELGLKVVLMAGLVPRPIPDALRTAPAATRYALWYDVFGIDSDHDYDPVWAKCEELGVSPTFHAGARHLGLRMSPSNFVFNHIGHFASAGEALCKAIFIGGVTRRFPKLKFAFLEGGVGWACNLYADLIGHWKKRNARALEDVNPANLDRAELMKLVRRFGGTLTEGQLARFDDALDAEIKEGPSTVPVQLDDYAACKLEHPEDIRDLFVPRFYFGCEADDPINAWAFNRNANPYDARLNTLFGSDISHFDVPDMKEVLVEAYELVDDHLISEADFRDFVFTNPVKFWAESMPEFFKGTVVENPAKELLATA